MFIGHYPARLGRVRWREMVRTAQAIGERIGLKGDLRRPAASLSPSDQRLVMIGRALVRDVKLLILDEPTASLPEDEVTLLLGVLRTLRDEGVTIVYISHRLEEVLALTDRTTVMKDAHVVATRPTPSLDKHELMTLIVGRELDESSPIRGRRRRGSRSSPSAASPAGASGTSRSTSSPGRCSGLRASSARVGPRSCECSSERTVVRRARSRSTGRWPASTRRATRSGTGSRCCPRIAATRAPWSTSPSRRTSPCRCCGGSRLQASSGRKPSAGPWASACRSSRSSLPPCGSRSSSSPAATSRRR